MQAFHQFVSLALIQGSQDLAPWVAPDSSMSVEVPQLLCPLGRFRLDDARWQYCLGTMLVILPVRGPDFSTGQRMASAGKTLYEGNCVPNTKYVTCFESKLLDLCSVNELAHSHFHALIISKHFLFPYEKKSPQILCYWQGSCNISNLKASFMTPRAAPLPSDLAKYKGKA